MSCSFLLQRVASEIVVLWEKHTFHTDHFVQMHVPFPRDLCCRLEFIADNDTNGDWEAVEAQ